MASSTSKSVILLRHGESLGQTARQNGKDRKSDASLVDCGLSRKGNSQATDLAQNPLLDNVDLVVVSPLTRALATALRAFAKNQSVPIICHPGARERGSTLRPIPENRGRPLNIIRRDLRRIGLDIDRVDMSLVPDEWPNHAVGGEEIDSDHDGLLHWIHMREERNICVVSHHNTIVLILGGSFQRIPNAAPIECEYNEGNTLRLKQDNLGSDISPTAKQGNRSRGKCRKGRKKVK